MEAIVLVGGQGTRLRPLTVNTPKPMLPVAGVPFLTHQLARLRAVGVDHVVLATSYRAEVFTDHYGDGSSLGLRIDYVTETEPLGTGGGIRNVAAQLDSRPGEPVIALNGDVLSGHDISAQLRLHHAAAAAATLHLVRVEDARPFGCVPTDGAGRVTAFLEKMPEPVSDQINAGCYVFDRAVIDAIPAGRVVSVERETFPELLGDGRVVMGYVDDAYWLDVGTPAAFIRAGADLVRGVTSSPAMTPTDGRALLCPGARVAADAAVVGGSTIGVGAVVDAGVTVDGSVVMDGARLGARSVVRRSVVGRRAVVGADCVVEDAVVGDDVTVGARNELVNGARVWPGVVLPETAVRFSSDV